MKLYTKPGACSTACHIVLCWGGGNFDFEIVDQAILKSSEFLKLNPMGQVPVLVDGDLVLTENVAVMHYIADLFSEAHLLGDGSKAHRAMALRWLAFVNSDIHPAFAMVFGADRISSDPKIMDVLAQAGRKRLMFLYGVIEQQLNHQEWLAGFRSVADAYLFMTLNWAKGIKLDLSSYQNITRYFEKMQNDEGVISAFKAEGLGK